MRKRGRWLLVVAVVLAAGLSYATYSLFMHTKTDYFTVSELKSQAESVYGRQTRVEGKVTPGTVDWDSESQTLRFVLADDGESLPVVYEGIVPDNFKPGTELVVVGNYGADGVFAALSLGSRRSLCNLCH